MLTPFTLVLVMTPDPGLANQDIFPSPLWNPSNTGSHISHLDWYHVLKPNLVSESLLLLGQSYKVKDDIRFWAGSSGEINLSRETQRLSNVILQVKVHSLAIDQTP